MIFTPLEPAPASHVCKSGLAQKVRQEGRGNAGAHVVAVEEAEDPAHGLDPHPLDVGVALHPALAALQLHVEGSYAQVLHLTRDLERFGQRVPRRGRRRVEGDDHEPRRHVQALEDLAKVLGSVACHDDDRDVVRAAGLGLDPGHRVVVAPTGCRGLQCRPRHALLIVGDPLLPHETGVRGRLRGRLPRLAGRQAARARALGRRAVLLLSRAAQPPQAAEAAEQRQLRHARPGPAGRPHLPRTPLAEHSRG